MAIKDGVRKAGVQMMSDPRVLKLMQNPQFMKLLMAAVQVPGRVNTFTSEQSERVARSMKLATKAEVKELTKAVARLEKQVARLEARIDED